MEQYLLHYGRGHSKEMILSMLAQVRKLYKQVSMSKTLEKHNEKVENAMFGTVAIFALKWLK